MYDVIIIGKGPAGISAALYTARANLRTLVISKDWGNLRKAEKVHNYYGADTETTGMDILESGVSQAKEFGVVFAEDEAVGLTAFDGIEVTGLSGKYKGKALILAMGAPKRKPPFENIERFEGNGISYCGACDGFFYKDRKIAVVGFNEFMLHEVMELSEITNDITILTNGMELDIADEYKAGMVRFNIEKEEIKGFYGNDTLEGVEFKSERREAYDGVFIAYGSASATDMAMKSGLLIEKGSISVDCDMRTNIPEIFAAGDCTGGFKQVAVAVGEGAIAAKSAIEYIRSLG